MSHMPPDRIPAGIESARKIGLRWQHYGWPGITRTLDGDILVGASERIRHVCPFGRTVVSRSSDCGRTWTGPDVIFESQADDRDCSLVTLPDGAVIASWFSSTAYTSTTVKSRLPEWEAIAAHVGADTLRALERGWLRRSHDGGRTWEDRVYPTIVGQHAGPSALSDGRLIYCGPAYPQEDARLLATLSEDRGKTWRIIGVIPCGASSHPHTKRPWPALNESHALETAPNKILCAFRGPGPVYFTRSEDGGHTWTPPEDSGVRGHPPYLIRLQAGPILCVFADRDQPQAIRGMLSYDDGATWDTQNVFTLREFTYRADMGYPVAVEANPNEVLCVYYSVPDPAPSVEQYNRLRDVDAGILSTRIQLGPL